MLATSRYLGEGFDDNRSAYAAGDANFVENLASTSGASTAITPRQAEVIVYDYVDADVPMCLLEWL